MFTDPTEEEQADAEVDDLVYPMSQSDPSTSEDDEQDHRKGRPTKQSFENTTYSSTH